MSDSERRISSVSLDSDSSEDESPVRRDSEARGRDVKEANSTSSSSSAPRMDAGDDDTDSEEGPLKEEQEEEKCLTHNHNLVNGHQEEDEEEDEEEEDIPAAKHQESIERKQEVESDLEEEPKVQPRKVQQTDEDDENALDFSDLPEKDSDGEQEQEEDDQEHGKGEDAVARGSPSPRSASPVEDAERWDSAPLRKTSQDSVGERKSSHGSSSYGEDEERASSMSPEPTHLISTPHTMVTSPSSSQAGKDITKIYTEALVNEKPAGSGLPTEKVVRPTKAVNNITEIYTASLHKEHASPKLERARGGKPVKDITQLYTAAFMKPEKVNDMPSPNRPRRNDNITKLYTGGFDAAAAGFKSKPNDEFTNPKKHNMATSLDKEAIRDAYNQVMGDNNGVEWAAFKFNEENSLVVSGTGTEFAEFKSQFGPDDRGFGYIKIQTGDEMSKRSRFALVTWVGSSVSVMKKAKMSTDKLLVKEIIQNLSVELQLESAHELNLDHLKAEVDKAGGARYGTGVRDK